MTSRSTPRTPLKDLTFGDVQRVANAMRRDDPQAAAQFEDWVAQLLDEPEIQQALLENAVASRAAEEADPLGFWEHRLRSRFDTLAELRRKDAPPAILRQQVALIAKAQAYVGYHRLRVASEAHQADPSPANEAALGRILEGPEFAAAMRYFHEQGGRPGRAN